MTETGTVRAHVSVFVGKDDIRWSGGLGAPVPGRAELVIISAVSGG